MQEIAEWLEKLGMSEYTQRFVENGIDVSILGYLTDQDLEKIGVLLGLVVCSSVRPTPLPTSSGIDSRHNPRNRS
jgi:hypothetical protein